MAGIWQHCAMGFVARGAAAGAPARATAATGQRGNGARDFEHDFESLVYIRILLLVYIYIARVVLGSLF